MTSFVDPNFTHHLAVGRILAKVATTLVDRQLLPFNFSRLAWKLSQCQDSLIVKHGEEFAKHGIKVGKVYMHFIRSLDEIQRNHRIINLIFCALSTLSLKKVFIWRQCILLKAEEAFRLLVLFSLSFNLGLKKWLTESRFGTEFLAMKSANSVWRKAKHATNLLSACPKWIAEIPLYRSIPFFIAKFDVKNFISEYSCRLLCDSWGIYDIIYHEIDMKTENAILLNLYISSI